MFDVAIAYNRFKFLGYEFLTWLWFTTENDQNTIKQLGSDSPSLVIGNRIVLENRLKNDLEVITIKGNDADLKEGRLALQKGAVVTELNLSYQAGDRVWKFTVKGESFNLGSIRLPETGPVESREDLEGVVMEKAFLYEKVFHLVDTLFRKFIDIRTSPDWKKSEVPLIKKWIFSS